MYEFIRSYRALYRGNVQVAIVPHGVTTPAAAVEWYESGAGGLGSHRFYPLEK